MASGLESIALAVAHLERVRSSEGQDVSERSTRITGSPSQSPSLASTGTCTDKKMDRSVMGRSNTNPSPSSHRHFASFPPNIPFGPSATRIVSIDNLNPSSLVGMPNDKPFYPENGSFHRLPSMQSHHDGSMTSPHHGHYQHHLHQHVLQQNAAASHQMQQELIYRLPNYQHPTQPLVMMQVPMSHQHVSHQTGHQNHKSHVSHSHTNRQSTPGFESTSSQSLSQIQTQGNTSVTVSPLPSAVLDLADNLEDFLSMELDHTVYTPVPMPSEVIVHVQKNDVLLGRGGETNHHIGNIQYRQLVKICQPAYLEAKRRDKPKIAERIVHAVRCLSGRFLKKDAETSTWRDVGNTRAREKTSQALREGAPELRTGAPGDYPAGAVPSSPSMCMDHKPSTRETCESSMIGFVTPSGMVNANGHRIVNMQMNPAYGVTSTPVFDPSAYASPSKKARICSSICNPNIVKNVPAPMQTASSRSPAASVTATISGDDEENSSNPSGPHRGSDFGQKSPNNQENRSRGEKRALPRLKLLKKRLEQGEQTPTRSNNDGDKEQIQHAVKDSQ